MNESNVKITIGCLLHDIGKVLYRYNDRRNHSVSGTEFLKDVCKIHDKDILEQVNFHHGKLLKSSNVSKDSFAYISYIADNISASIDRRDKYDGTGGFVRNLPLESIFNILNGNNQNFKYRCTLMDTDKIQYPTDTDIQYTESFYNNCIQIIKEALKSIEYNNSYSNSMLEILESCLSFVPSSTSTAERADISLFDHVKMTAGFGNCIYNYLKENNIVDYKSYLFENAEKFYNEKAFIIYSMDISGIQDFIYTITSKGALKSLRARSFYIELLMEYMTDEILEMTGFCRTNLIYCGGGHAYILLDNTDRTKKAIIDFEKSMNKFFIDNFSTALYIAGGMAECSANDLKNVPEGSYSNIFKTISNMISKCKSMRYNAEDILKLNNSNEFDSTRECKVCKRTDNLNREDICYICDRLNKFSIKIQEKPFFVVVDNNKTNDGLPLPSNRFLVAESKDELLIRIKNKESYVRAYCKNEQYTGLNIASKLWVGDYKNGDTFEDLANSSKGIKRLAVLRADIDNLGKAFVSGFDNVENNNKYVTISRTATFSRKLALFFKLNINSILKNRDCNIISKSENPKRNIAIVYSGGDDVFVVGAWNDVIEFAVDLNTAFSKFSQNTLTLSAGIGIYPSKYPISAMAKETGQLEECSKSYENKNAVTIFDETGTYNWNKFKKYVLNEKYKCISEFFDDSENERGKSFIYNLLEYIRNSQEKINIPRFAYTLARLEPSKRKGNEKSIEKYNEFAKNMFNWIKNDTDRKQLITAIYLYVYSIRGEEE